MPVAAKPWLSPAARVRMLTVPGSELREE